MYERFYLISVLPIKLVLTFQDNDISLYIVYRYLLKRFYMFIGILYRLIIFSALN